MWTKNVHVFFVLRGNACADEQQAPKNAGIMAELIHIGRLIQEELRVQGRSVTWLAQQLGTSRMACYRLFHSYSIDTQMLFWISGLLGRDFFAEYSGRLTASNGGL